MTDTTSTCDVSLALQDVAVAMLNYVRTGTLPESEELKHWLDWVSNAQHAHSNLAVACEDLVELGVTDDRIAAMKQALTRAQGQAAYCARKDRW
jgi:hypothetical protein